MTSNNIVFNLLVVPFAFIPIRVAIQVLILALDFNLEPCLLRFVYNVTFMCF